MPDVKMMVYDAMFDVSMVFHWANEEEYQLAEQFLTDIGASRGQLNDVGDKKPEFYLENQRQRDAFHRFRRSLEKRRPRSSDPPSLEMEIYAQTTGVEMTIAWANEEEYQLGKKFLTDMGASCGQSGEVRRKKLEFFYLENERQLEALFEFRRTLREKRKT